MEVPLLAGVYVGNDAAVRVAYPVNMVPVPGQDNLADAFLRPAEGIIPFGAGGPGVDRGAIVCTTKSGPLSGVHFRVSGTSLISVSAAGVVAVLGTIGGTGPVKMDFSFDLLGIAANNLLYYWNGISVTHVTDPNIPSTIVDMLWVDGYWMVTDGIDIYVSQLTDPNTFNALKFGSTDEPDPVQALQKVQNITHVISQHFIDVFNNVGTALFPFQRDLGGRITKGAAGTRACCVFNDTVAFVGGGKDESPCVYQGHNAQVIKISTREIDLLLKTYTPTQLASVTMQAIFDEGSQFIFINLPDRTIVYDGAASAAAGQSIWHTRVSTLAGFSLYKFTNIVLANGVRIGGDPTSTAIGQWSTSVSTHFGAAVRWEFSTRVLRNGGKGAIIHQMDLEAITGQVPASLPGNEPRISTSYSVDGINWSQDKSALCGTTGDSTKRITWFHQGMLKSKGRIQRFRGDSTARIAAVALMLEVEGLMY